MIIFVITRAVFYIYYFEVFSREGISYSELFQSFWYAIPLDISTACYILALPFLILVIQSFWSPRFLNTINKVYTLLAILLYVLITVGELGIYEEWKTKLQFKALLYLSNPDEVYNTADTSTFFLLLSIILAEVILFFWIFRKWFYTRIEFPVRKIVYSVSYLLVGSFLVFIGIRGGLSEIPITQSKSYFSHHNFINLGSVNSGYSLLISTLENYKFRNENPFAFYDLESAKKRVQRLHEVEIDTTTHILNKKTPNIVLIILESWSADLIETLGGKPGITPEFRKLEKDGLLFTDLYVSGNRSEQAMTALFAGFPSTPITAISHNLDKIVRLPSFTNILKDQGYLTSYYFGGQLMYGGINSFISVNGFETIKEIADFDNSLPKGKLGIHDEFIFEEQIKDLKKVKEPFFSAIFTVSTHSPYDQPMEDVIFWGENKGMNGYLNSAYYTDKCLGEYIEKAKQQPWYDNTLFVLVADHSHETYNHWPVHSKEYRKVPMLFYGDVIKSEFRGKTIDRLSSQTDLTVTLLAQLDLPTEDFPWSRNLFNPHTPEFVFYESTDGVGWVTPDGYFVYSKTLNDMAVLKINSPVRDSIIKDGKSYLQVLFQEFMDY